MSGYPPGVTGNEPHLTGEYPCSVCGGAGGDYDEDGGHACCWMCGGSGVHPEEPPFCPECGSQETEWYADQTEPVKAAIVDMIGEVAGCDDFNIVYCNDCGEASR